MIFMHAGADEAITSKKYQLKLSFFIQNFVIIILKALGILKFLLTRLISFSKFGDEFLLRNNEIIVKTYSSTTAQNLILRTLLIGLFSFRAFS